MTCCALTSKGHAAQSASRARHRLAVHDHRKEDSSWIATCCSDLSGVAASLGSTSEAGSCHAQSGSSGVKVCSSSGTEHVASLDLSSLAPKSRKFTSCSVLVGDDGDGDCFRKESLSISCKLWTESLTPAEAWLRDRFCSSLGTAEASSPELCAEGAAF